MESLYYFIQPMAILVLVIVGASIFLNKSSDTFKQATTLLISFFALSLIMLVAGFKFELVLILLLHSIIITLLTSIGTILPKAAYKRKIFEFKKKSRKYLIPVFTAMMTLIIELIIIIYTTTACEIKNIELEGYNLSNLAMFNECVMRNYTVLFGISVVLLVLMLIFFMMLITRKGSKK